MLTLLQIIRKLWKTLNGDASPRTCAAAVFIGCLLGLTPFGVQTIFLLLLLLIFAVPLSVALVTSTILKALDLLIVKSLAAALGELLLSPGSATRDVIVGLLKIPVIGLVPLERHGVTGGLALGAVLGALLAYPTLRAIRAYRRSLQARVADNRCYRVLKKCSWLFGGALKGGKLA